VEKETKHSIVIKSNSLIDAVYKMPVNSAHLFSIMLRHIIANNIITDNGQLHTITAAEYGTLLGIDKKNQYRELKIATKFLLSAIIKVPLTKDRYREYSIFDTAEYAIGHGYTSLAFSRNFLPFIQNLQGDYTRLKLAETLRLKKFASIRIYEKLMQYRQADDSGWWRVEMDELKKFLNIEREHIYWSNNHFRIKVFNPAIKEITKQLEWDIKVKNIKAGRTIKELEISFKDVNKGGLFSKDNMAKGNKQTRLNQANRDADLRAKIAQLSHHKKIGIK
jgi:plasmid replication initiation protein